MLRKVTLMLKVNKHAIPSLLSTLVYPGLIAYHDLVTAT